MTRLYRKQESQVPHPFISDYDLYLFSEGTHYRTYEKMGAHTIRRNGVMGTNFAVWAPNARNVSIVGDFNGWNRASHLMQSRGDSGVWECFIPEVGQGELYKIYLESHHRGFSEEKSDPYGFASELRPGTASRVWDIGGYGWNDQEWMAHRAGRHALTAPMSVYEVHLGSWMRAPEEADRWLTYRELATKLSEYVKHMGFTHVELLPISEHPFDGSWGYQPTGYFAPTSRFGTPDDFMHFVDVLHQNDIGVILDWVPAHFPKDGHGLAYFDGTHLYEHEDPRKGEHQDWGTYIFNYGRREVVNFLISNALFWLDKYHIDGLRVDAVASMLYLDYSREDGDWIPNEQGGRENTEAVQFVRRFNEQVYAEYPDTITIAEESTAWTMVSRPTYLGGLGFGLKWDMGWMHDTLKYFENDPIHRKHHHSNLTFRMLYAFTENFALPLSHDEVVHGKGSLLRKMPGNDEQKFAHLRSLFGYMFAQSGKKLLFQGGEIGQWDEWDHDKSVDWHLLQYPLHQGLQRWIRDLNTTYRAEPAFHELDASDQGFEWIDCGDDEASTISLLRRGSEPDQLLVVACNFTPVTRTNYRIGVPDKGMFKEILNSDAALYGGSDVGNFGEVRSTPISMHGRPYSINITLPPASVLFFKPVSS